jgi:hypothetical protein
VIVLQESEGNPKKKREEVVEGSAKRRWSGREVGQNEPQETQNASCECKAHGLHEQT